MRKTLTAAALAAATLLAACGPDNNITVTNTENVVLNDEQADYASLNDNEMPANEMGASMSSEPMNGTATGTMTNSTDMGNSTAQ